MDMMTGDMLRSLVQEQVGICVSMYMPTIQKGTETQQNQIRYKNLLRKAEEYLMTRDLRPSEIRDLMSPAQELLGDVPFWKNQKNGLAMFISPNIFEYYRIPQRFEELVVVSDRFHLKPLIPILGNMIDLYILAISQNSVRLFECTQYTVTDRELEGVPQNIDEALNLDTYQKRLQLHTGSEDTKANILQYFKIVDRGLKDILRDKKVPLIFAGVDYLYPLYKEANTYPYLADTAIAGNPEDLSGDELLEQARPIINSLLEKKRMDAIALYKQNAGTGLASDDLQEIVAAACHGRSGVLFITVDKQQWGTFDPATSKVYLSEFERPGYEDLLDLAAIQTHLNGGTVYSINPTEMPVTTSLAAIFRY